MSSTTNTSPARPRRGARRRTAVLAAGVLAASGLSAGLAAPAHADSDAGVTYAYVADAYAGTVSAVDTATGTTTATITVGGAPFALAVSPDGATLYVPSAITNVLSVISTATDAVTATIAVGSDPDAVVLNSSGTTAYVANELDDTISVIDTATGTVSATIPVSGYTEGLALSPDDSSLYVTGFDPDQVTVIDTGTDAVTATIPLGAPAFGVAIDPSGTTAYVATAGANTVTVLDTATDTVTGTIPDPDVTSLAFTPDGDALYAVSPGNNDVTVIDPAANTITDTITGGLDDPQRIAINSAGTTAYITNIVTPNGSSPGFLSALDLASGTLSTNATGLAGGPTPVGLHTVPAPAVTGLAPGRGPLTAGTQVTITGTNLTGATAITFGADGPATGISCTATTCTATAPAGTAGTVDVQITTPGGTSAATAADQYTYAKDTAELTAAPLLFSLSPGNLSINLDLSATLTDTTTNEPVVGATIAFTVGHNTVCTATTGSHGVATCAGPCPVLQVLLALSYTATYAGSVSVDPASATAGLIQIT